ncbi:hypothetical protein D307_gp180 [Bacillus phage Bastille]|uniref:Uncharacterized protein n=1 Tax=Bacillus phage Bastille TaxID=57477 RepID=J9PKI1_9CAUD|nr:hypothetical protein D307_gp180 [Bacillus phage Bastille]AEQ34284.1 hypothetical protein [Bacillus phage Bastille]
MTYEDMQAEIKFQEQQLLQMKQAAEVQRLKEKGMKFESKGIWKVTTEGDEEGRSTRDLGIHKGDIIYIAQKLAQHEFYKLTFTRVNPKEEDVVLPQKGEVHITVYGDDNIEDEHDLLAALAGKALDGEKVSLGQYYKSVKFTWGLDK